MKTDSIYFKVDQAIKKKAQKKAAELGMSLSDVLNGYLRRFLKVKSVEFVEEGEQLVPTAYLKRLLKQSEKDIKAGYISPAFDNIEDELAWLDDPDARYQNGRRVR